MSTCLVTCGPAFARIDSVRRITNFSTGELGVILAEELALAGHRVICCKGEMATWPDPAGCEVRRFQGNGDLLQTLREIARTETVSEVYHAAALSDFIVSQVRAASGDELALGKIPSSIGELKLHLMPAVKLLPELRALFPKARLTAWKYELEGTQADALARARRQILENQTDACVLNGQAYGPGYGFLRTDLAHPEHFPDKRSLCVYLASRSQG